MSDLVKRLCRPGYDLQKEQAIQEAIIEIRELRAKIEEMEKQEPAPGAQPAPKAVAYLDLGVGGYMDIGTDLTDEQLASLPKGRHMLGIVGTYGVDGYVSAQQCKNCNGMGDRFDPSGEKIPCDLCESNLEEIRVLVAEAAHDIISGSDFWLSTSLAAKKIYALPGAKGEEK